MDYATDRALYGKEVALRNFKEAILVEALTDVVFDSIRIPSLGNKTIGDWIKKGINHEIGSPMIYSVLNEVFRDPAFKAELMRRLAFVVNFLTEQARNEFAEELIGLDHRVGHLVSMTPPDNQ